jgi:hypothetical protein
MKSIEKLKFEFFPKFQKLLGPILLFFANCIISVYINPLLQPYKQDLLNFPCVKRTKLLKIVPFGQSPHNHHLLGFGVCRGLQY